MTEKAKKKPLICERLPDDWHQVLPPKRPHVIEPDVPRRAVSALISAGNLGKSTLQVERICHVALGLEWRGQPVEQGDVSVLTWEDETKDYQAKFFAVVNAYPELKAKVKEIRERVLFWPMHGLQRHFVEATKDRLSVSVFVKEIAEAIKQAQPNCAWIVVETASRASAGDETNEGMRTLVEALESVAVDLNAACSVSHHVNKGAIQSGAIDATAARGGSALVDNCRATTMLVPVAKAGADDLPSEFDKSQTKGRDVILVMNVRASYSQRAEPIFLERVYDGNGLPYFTEFVPETKDEKRNADDAVLLTYVRSMDLTKECYKSDITKALHGTLSRRQVDESLNRLHQQGKVELISCLQFGDKGRKVQKVKVLPE